MTNYHYFHGTAEFYQNRKPDEYGNYKLLLKFDDPEDYIKSGIQVNMTEDGCVWFRRPDVKLIKGSLETLGPPETVTDDEEGNAQPFKQLVGKGSKVVAKVRSYDTTKGTGHTLDAVKIIELVPVPHSGEYHNF